MSDNTTDLIIKVKSYSPWPAEVWERLFPQIEALVQTPLTCLDERDPIRRKVDGGKGQGEYIGSFRGRSSCNYAGGKFGKSGVWFMVNHGKWPGRIENAVSFFLPAKAVKKLGLAAVEAVFDVFSAELSPFFQICDVEPIVNSRKPSPPRTILHHSFELGGVFWLTFFGAKYRAFFGDGRFSGLPHQWTENGGVKLKLGEDPWQLEDEKRRDAERALGELSFASWGENKKENEHVLPWPSLLEGDFIKEYERREAAGIKPGEPG